MKSDRNFSRTAPAVAANPFIRSPDPLPAPLSRPLLWQPPLILHLCFSLSLSLSLVLSSPLSLAIGVAMYTPGRIYRPVFQPPCGGNGFRNAADTARPVLITIHTYCPHILPIPRALPLATDYITTYGEHKLLWLPFYRRPATSGRLFHRLTTDHLTPSHFFAMPAPQSLPTFFFPHSSLSTFTNYKTRGRRGGTVKRSRGRESTAGRPMLRPGLRPPTRAEMALARAPRKFDESSQVPRVEDILRPVTYGVCKCTSMRC